MAPEQHRGVAATDKSDQFSFCLSLYAALYGVAPFTGGGTEAVTDVDSAAGVSPFTGGGTDAFTDTDSGTGIAPFSGGGTKVYLPGGKTGTGDCAA